MVTIGSCMRGMVFWMLGVVACVMSPLPAYAQYSAGDEAASSTEEEGVSFQEAYVARVDRLLAGLQTEVNNQRALLTERGQELLEEIGLRLDETRAKMPDYFPLPGEAPPPDPPSVLRLNAYDSTLSEGVYEIESRIMEQMDEVSAQRDSLYNGLKTPDQVLPLVDELDKSIRTNLDLWRAKVDFVRGRLIADGTPDEARRMFVRAYNAIALHYQMGQYKIALDRMVMITDPYGDLPFPEWLESLPFYKAECLYALGEWDRAFEGYQVVWQQPTSIFGPQALLNWSELAFAGQEYRKLATMWVAQPRLPADPIDANRIRLLVAESYLRLNELQAALQVLDQVERERPALPGELDLLGPEGLAELQATNTRLVVYGQLLRTEAHLSEMQEEGKVLEPGFSRADTTLVPDMTEEVSPDSVVAIAVSGPSATDSAQYYSDTAFLLASGRIRSTKKRDELRMNAAILDLENLLPVVRRIDREGPLMARTLVALGHAYFQQGRWGDAAAAYGATPVSSVWYPEAQLGRAWAFMEQGNYLDAKTAINIARRWPLSPSAVLEASALNSYVLSQIGDDEQAAAQVRQMIVSVSIEERRAASAWVARQVQQIDESLRLIGVLSLERQNEELYRSALEERTRLERLREEVQEVEQALQAYAVGTIEDTVMVTSHIQREQQRLSDVQQRVTEMRRQAGQLPAEEADPELTYQRRRDELRHWLSGIEPLEVSQERKVYEEWVEYAEFAYARRIFDENQRRRERAASLKDMSGRIRKLLSESP